MASGHYSKITQRGLCLQPGQKKIAFQKCSGFITTFKTFTSLLFLPQFLTSLWQTSEQQPSRSYMWSLYSRNRNRHTDSAVDCCIDFIYVAMLSLEALLALRWIWLTSGNHLNGLIPHLISKLSAPFAAPFSTLFRTVGSREVSYIFDFYPLAMMFFYGLMGLLFGQVLRVLLGDRRP